MGVLSTLGEISTDYNLSMSQKDIALSLFNFHQMSEFCAKLVFALQIVNGQDTFGDPQLMTTLLVTLILSVWALARKMTGLHEIQESAGSNGWVQ